MEILIKADLFNNRIKKIYFRIKILIKRKSKHIQTLIKHYNKTCNLKVTIKIYKIHKKILEIIMMKTLIKIINLDRNKNNNKKF